ncbi:MAG: hypothetical protein QOD44_3422, partial [Solirubrobacteraceae bacterium]|nr:hypothetical protein [Solirubrobacteraceae bacterium]
SGTDGGSIVPASWASTSPTRDAAGIPGGSPGAVAGPADRRCSLNVSPRGSRRSPTYECAPG